MKNKSQTLTRKEKAERTRKEVRKKEKKLYMYIYKAQRGLKINKEKKRSL